MGVNGPKHLFKFLKKNTILCYSPTVPLPRGRSTGPHALVALSARRGRGSIAASLFPAHAPRPLCPPAPPQGLASIAASLFPARTPRHLCQCRSSVLACPCARAAPAPPASNISSSWPGPQAVRFLLLQPAVHVSLQLNRVSYTTFFVLRGVSALISSYPIDRPMSTPIDALTPNTHCRHKHVSAASPGDTADDFPTTFHVPSKRSACRRLPAQPTETLPCHAHRKRNRPFTPSSAPEPIVSHTVHGAFSGTNLDIPDDFPTTFHIRRSTRRRLAAQPTEIPRPDVAHADPCQKYMAATSATSRQGGAVEWEVTTHKTPVPHRAVASKARKQNPSSSMPSSSGVAMAPAGGGDEVGESGGPSKRHRVERRDGGAKEGQSLGVESGSGKSKDPVMPKGWIECLEVRCEDSQRIIKEIEDLKSELDEDLRQLGYCEENEKLRAELAVKVKEMHCLMKRIEELEAKNDLLKKRTEELEAINDGLPKRNENLQAKNGDLRKQNMELQAEHEDLTKQNKELQARNAGLTKGNEEMQAKNDDDLHKNIMEILEIQTDARRKDLLQFLGLYSIMDFPYTQLKSSDEALLSEGNKIKASSVVAAGSDPKIQIKALISQLLSLTQQVVSADSIQAKDADLANQKEEIKSPKAYLGEESYSNEKDFSQQKIEDGEKLEKVLRATKAILEAISAEKETAEESLKVVQAELEANKSSLAQALSDRDSACQVTGKNERRH